MAFGKPHRRPPDEDQRVLPLINVVFLLLIFFMVAGQLTKTDPVKILPPESFSEKDPGESQVHILMTADGDILINGENVAPTDLTPLLVNLIQNREKKTVHLKADGNTDATKVLALLEKIKAAGADTVKLLTSEKIPP